MGHSVGWDREDGQKVNEKSNDHKPSDHTAIYFRVNFVPNGISFASQSVHFCTNLFQLGVLLKS